VAPRHRGNKFLVLEATPLWSFVWQPQETECHEINSGRGIWQPRPRHGHLFLLEITLLITERLSKISWAGYSVQATSLRSVEEPSCLLDNGTVGINDVIAT
jgi:hypothetical protein